MAGSLAQRPGIGGHTWVFLQWILGLRALGWEVVFLDWLRPDMCRDELGTPCPPGRSVNLKYFHEVTARFGLHSDSALLIEGAEEPLGLSRRTLMERLQSSAALLNVMGFLADGEVLESVGRRVFVDIDPGFGQFWSELGLHDTFHGHEDFVTVGANVGRPGCRVPTCGHHWIPTLPPVVLDRWPPIHQGRAFTTVASWRGPFGPIDYGGRRYGLRVHEFRKLLPLPRRTGSPFELALDIHPGDRADLERLSEHRWSLADPREVAGDPMSYRRYIQGSMAEFAVAKNLYVDTHSGWFSDRSACYLASGKPVLAQDTGFASNLPVGEGLLSFGTLDQAVAGVEEIERNYDSHARAAREIAEEHFDSSKVLGRLLGELRLA